MTVVHDNLEKTEAKMRVEAVSVFYGDKKAIDEVSIDILTEYVTAFIGPSGCGKSTSCGLPQPHERHDPEIGPGRGLHPARRRGHLRSGMDVVQLRARVGMVFQKLNPFPKSIYENIAHGPKIHGLAESKDELDAIVEKFAQAARWPVGGGQGTPAGQRHGAVGRSAAAPVYRTRYRGRPEVILMDEPCSALDPIATARSRN